MNFSMPRPGWPCTRVLRLAWFASLMLAACTVAMATPAHDFDFGDRYFESVGSVDDIPYGIVTAIVQDARGMMWLGTQSGLLRFDGYRFRRFKHEPDNPASLSGDFVQSLAIDRTGRIWVGTESDGLAVLDPQTERFRRFRHDPTNVNSIGPGPVHALAMAADGAMWVAADVGLVSMDLGADHFVRRFVEHQQGDAALRVQSLLFAHDGSLWVGARDGLLHRAPGEQIPRRFATVGGNALDGREISKLFEASDGRLWIGTHEHGAAVLDPIHGTLQWIGAGNAATADLGLAWINAIAQPTPDEIWLSRFGKGMLIVDAISGDVRHVMQNDPGMTSGLGFDAIGDLFVDRNGLLWVGTWGGGLQRHNPRNQAISSLRHSTTLPHHLSHPSVLRLLELHDGRILAGSTGNGIDIIDRRIGVIGGWRADVTRDGALADATVSALAQSDDGTLWVGTYQGGVQRLDPGSDRFRRYTRDQGLPSLQIEYAYISSDGTLWIGTGDGLTRHNAQQDRFELVDGVDGAALRMRINVMDEEVDGRIWVATSNGLFTIDPGTRVLRGLQHDEARADSLSSDHVLSVLVDREQRVWVDTAKGLDRLQRDSAPARFEHISAQLGRPGESFGGNLLEDGDGRIWTPLFLLNSADMSLYELHRVDGFDIGAQWNGSSALTRDGHLLFGGSKGIAIIDPSRFQPWLVAPEVTITALMVDGQVLPDAAITNSLVLQSTQRHFDVEFSTTDFSAPQFNRYQYRLLGFASEWIEVDADHRHAGFSNLWPGDYTLELRARNRAGTYSDEATRLQIKVMPRVWQRSWFVVAAFIAAIALSFGLLRLVFGHYRRRALALQKLVDERTTALREAYAQADLASRTDLLSGLGNRRSATQLIPAMVATLREYLQFGHSERRLALLLIDIDAFKSINDRHGHRIGDRVIAQVGQRIASMLRDGDLAVRWGGEEFLLVMHLDDEAQAWASADRLCREVAAHTLAMEDTDDIRTTVSIGVACLPFDQHDWDAISWEQTLEIADAAMYIAKREGRNRVYGFRATGPLPEEFIERFRRDPEGAPALLPVELMRISGERC